MVLALICLLAACSTARRDALWRSLDPLGYYRVHDEPYLYRENNTTQKNQLSSPERRTHYLPDMR